MKRCVCVLIVYIGLLAGLAAQDAQVPYFSVNTGAGSNNLLVEGMSFGTLADVHFRFLPQLAAGIKTGLNFSTDGITAVETQVYARWYFLRPGIQPGASPRPFDLFVQGGIGLLGAFKGSDVRDSRTSLLFDGALGLTILLPSNWHVELSGRGGYPFMYGGAVTVGHKFPLMGRTEYIELPPIEKTVEKIVVEYRDPDPIEIYKEIYEKIVEKTVIDSVEYVIFAAYSSKYNEGLDGNARALNDLILNQLVQKLNENPEFRIRIEGHANPVKNNPEETETLYALSTERANELSRLLTAQGVKEEQIVIIISHGGTRTVTSSPDDWGRNRRVELIVFDFDSYQLEEEHKDEGK